eukprot:6450397-Lingulodinium_polyedra.AAC.1
MASSSTLAATKRQCSCTSLAQGRSSRGEASTSMPRLLWPSSRPTERRAVRRSCIPIATSA